MIKEGIELLDQLKASFEPSNEVQEKAMGMLLEIGLPTKKSEAYKFTPITGLLEKQLAFEVSSATVDPSVFYQTEGNHLVFVNGVYTEEHSKLIDDLTILKAEVTEGKHDPFSLLNTAFCKEETQITIDSKVAPTFIYHFNSDGFTNPRIKILVRKGQEATFVEKSFNSPGSFSNSFIQFNIEENASANHSKIQHYLSDTIAHETLVVDQSRDSRYYSNVFSFAGGMIRNNITLNLDDENCEGYMYGLYLTDGKTHVDNNTSVDHLKPNSYSNELYKGILDDQSTGVFNGKIYVRPQAQKTNAFQSNNNISLSDTATLHTKPQLEIWADDVKCSHGCTSGQLDEDAIFYLRARGINEKSAKAMILNAFAAESMDHVTIDELREELQSLISNRLM